MHHPDYTPPTYLPSSIHNTSIPAAPLINLQFAPNQHPPEEHKLGNLIRDRTQRKEFFYGIEILPLKSQQTTITLDYNGFGTMLPLFTSLVWLGPSFWNVEPLVNIESIRLMQKLQPHTIVLPHFSCYRLTRSRVADLMAMNISNILVVRGDDVEPEQDFKHASELVTEIRKLRGDTISIGVAGYPEGHPQSDSFEEDLDHLAQKVNAGADFIITQICYSSKSLIKFITACRAKGITVPIILGIFVPDNMKILRRMEQITEVHMNSEQVEEYEARAEDSALFQEYAQQQAVQMIKDVFESGLDIYGVHFFTMNKFKNVQQSLQKLLQEITIQNKSENLL